MSKVVEQEVKALRKIGNFGSIKTGKVDNCIDTGFKGDYRGYAAFTLPLTINTGSSGVTYINAAMNSALNKAKTISSVYKVTKLAEQVSTNFESYNQRSQYSLISMKKKKDS